MTRCAWGTCRPTHRACAERWGWGPCGWSITVTVTVAATVTVAVTVTTAVTAMVTVKVTVAMCAARMP